MSTWRVRESRELGKETRLLELRREGLSVGRNSDCDVQLLSRTVEERHAVFEWNQKNDAFAVRDLGSVNGTYVNNQPLRGGAAVLRHGDSIRFGYEKIHLFRVEVVEALPSIPQPPILPSQSSVVPSQSPLLPSQSTVVPPQLPSQSTVVATQTSPLVAENNVPRTTFTPATSQPAVSVQYVPIPSQPPTIIIPTMQPAMPYMVPQTLAYGYSPVTPLPLHPPPPGNFVFQPVSSAHSLPQQQLATPTSTWSDPILVEDIETPSWDATASRMSPKVAGTPRSDGRRSVAISAAPNLSKGSMLYGQPSWWGEEGGSNVAPELGHQGSRILRDLSPERVTPRHDQENSAPVRVTQSWNTTRAEAELRKQAISNSQLAGLERDEDNASPGSWVIEFGSGQPRRRSFTSHKIHRPRSADPSPSRVGRTPSPCRRSVSPVNSPKQSPLPRQRVTSPRPSPLPQQRGAKSDSGKKKEGSSALLRKVTTKKPPAGSKQSVRRSLPASTPVRPMRSTCRSTVRVKPIPVTQSLDLELPIPATAPVEGVRQDTNEDVKVERDTTYTVSQSETSIPDLNLVSDKVPLSSSSPTSPHPPALKCPSDTTMVIGGREEQSEPTTFVVEEERPYSARKQWKKDQTQPRDSLMLASIEARMRRLSKMAQTSAMALSSLQPSIQQRGGAEGGGEEGGEGAEVATCTSPDPNSSKSEQELPEWKFFNKDVDSIFQNIRAVEKWLRDIDSTVASLQVRGMEGGEELEGEREEGVDYHQDFESSDSEADLFEDSIEDMVDSQLDNSNTEEV